MKKFIVNYNTGVTAEAATLEDAKALAEQGLTYTGESVTIIFNGETVATLPFYGCSAENDDIVTADFGSFGFYGEWY